MEIVGWVIVVVFVLVAASATMAAISAGGRQAVLFGFFAFVLLAGAVAFGVTTVKLSSPAPTGSVGKDFYQVRWEEKTLNGTTMVVVRDESGKFYFSEFDSPLGVSKVLVVEKERFRPLLLPEKPK